MTETAGAAFARLVQDQFSEERARKQSLENRAAALVTSSGAFVSVVLAVAALAGAQGLGVPREAAWTLTSAVVCLLAAAAAGVLAGMPRGYSEPDAAELGRYIERYWDADALEAAKVVAQATAANLQDARRANGKKATILVAGGWLQAASLALLAATACLVLTR